MRSYTVIGVYDETGEVFAREYRGKDGHQAMRAAATIAASNGQGESLQILCAMPGAQIITPASDDSGKSAYACDLAN